MRVRLICSLISGLTLLFLQASVADDTQPPAPTPVASTPIPAPAPALTPPKETEDKGIEPVPLAAEEYTIDEADKVEHKDGTSYRQVFILKRTGKHVFIKRCQEPEMCEGLDS